MEKQMFCKTIILTFCLLQPRPRDQSQWTNVSHGKNQFLGERNLRTTREFYIYMVIYWLLWSFIKTSILFFAFGFSLTTTHKSQNYKGMERAFFKLLTTASTCFTDTLDISWAITAESWPLRIGNSRTRSAVCTIKHIINGLKSFTLF